MKAIRQASKPDGNADATATDQDISEIKDQVRRDEILKNAIKSGQERIRKSTSATNKVGKVSDFVLGFKDVIDLAVKTNPQAALPWAGVCIGLTFLLNPAQASQDNLAGIGYVAARMQWYCSLTDKLLSRKYIDTSKGQSYEDVLKLLEGRIIDLYKELLLFQMKSVCSYYKNQGWVFIRNLINLDDWDGQLESVKSAETTMKQDSKQFFNVEGQELMRNLVQTAQATQETLGDFHQTLQDYITEQRQKYQDDELGQCLKDLYVIDPQAQMSTIQGKNDRLVRKVYKWVLDTEEYQALSDSKSSCQVLWLHGPAGTGKTMLNIGIISEMFARPSNVTSSISYFFCEARGEGQTRAVEVLRTLIWGLLIQQPLLFSHLKDSHKFSGAAMFNAPDAFYNLRDKFMAMLADERLTPVCLVIDALDECEDDQPGVQDLIEIVSESLQIPNSPANIKWLLSSRPEIDLSNRLSDEATSKLNQLDVQSRPEPLDQYISYKLSQVKRSLRYGDDTLKKLDIQIRERAQNTFLWVALVLKDLIKNRVKEYSALDEIQKNPSTLFKLYERMMTRIEKGSQPDSSRSVLEIACFALRSLSYSEIHVISGLPSKVPAEDIVQDCGSFLTVEDGKVHVLHNSAREYLTGYFKTRSTQIHDLMFEHSLAALSGVLKSNVYDILPGCEISNVIVPQNDPLAPLSYSCEHWVEHFCKGTGQMSEEGHMWGFLKYHFLHWLESLSLLGKLSKAILSIRKLQDKAKPMSEASPGLVAFLKDAERFTMKNLTVMTNFPLQIYGTALLFSPNQSIVRSMFFGERNPSVEKFAISTDRWDSCRQTLNSGIRTRALVYSPDNTCFASALTTGSLITVKIWDASIGDCIRTMQIDSDGFKIHIAFTCDSKGLVIAAENKVCLLDVNTGKCRHNFELSGSVVSFIAFSPNGSNFAIASDCTTQLWDVSTWTHRRTLEGHTKTVTCVAFAPNSEIIATRSEGIIEFEIPWKCDSSTVKLWNHLDGTCIKVIEMASNDVYNMFFSPDGGTLVTHSITDAIQLWDVSTGTQKGRITNGESQIYHASLSPDGKFIAAAGFDNIMLLSVETGKVLQRLSVECDYHIVVFSPDMKTLVSGAEMGLLRVWDLSTSITQLSNGHSKEVEYLCFSQNAKLLATESSDTTVKLWNTSDGSLKHTLEGYHSFLVLSPDSKLLLSLSNDAKFWIWDTDIGILKQTLEFVCEGKHMMRVGSKRSDAENEHGKDHDNSKPEAPNVKVAQFSPNGNTLAIGTDEGKVIIWDVPTWECIRTLEGDISYISCVHFIRGGDALMIEGMIGGIELWNLDTGTCEQQLTDIRGPICPSSDGSTIISLHFGHVMQVWDVKTGICKQTIYLSTDNYPSSMSFIDNDRYLKTGWGVFSFSSGVLASTPDPVLSKSTLVIKGGWVMQNGEKIFNLSDGFFSGIWFSHENKLALTSLGGEVALVEFVNST